MCCGSIVLDRKEYSPFPCRSLHGNLNSGDKIPENKFCGRKENIGSWKITFSMCHMELQILVFEVEGMTEFFVAL